MFSPKDSKPNWQLISNFVLRIFSCETTHQLLKKFKTLKGKYGHFKLYLDRKENHVSKVEAIVAEKEIRNKQISTQERSMLKLRKDMESFLTKEQQYCTWLQQLKKQAGRKIFKKNNNVKSRLLVNPIKG